MLSVSLAALQTTYPLSSLTLPSSAINFVFGEMQCSGPREKVCVGVGVCLRGRAGGFFSQFCIFYFPFNSKIASKILKKRYSECLTKLNVSMSHQAT